MTADDKRRHVNLLEPTANVPALESAGGRPLVRSLHGAVDVCRLARGHALELAPRRRPAVEVAVEVHVHRLLVFRIVVGFRALVAFHDLDHLGRKLGAQAELFLRPLVDAGERGAEHEAHDARGARGDVLLREHPSPGRSEQVNPVEAERPLGQVIK